MTTNLAKKRLLLVGQGLLVLIVATTFTLLALWQWDRAVQHQELEAELVEIASRPSAPLTSIHQPQIALDGSDANRLVELTGRYLASFVAAKQAAGDYQVGLFLVDGSVPKAAILVARQVIDRSQEVSEVNRLPIDQTIQLRARLLPTQREDWDPSARIGGDQVALARLDTAILVERFAGSDFALYDGFLLLQSEEVAGVASELSVIPDSIAEPTIPGYYWQHISYVLIWLLMALLTLYLPFYQRRRNRLIS